MLINTRIQRYLLDVKSVVRTSSFIVIKFTAFRFN